MCPTFVGFCNFTETRPTCCAIRPFRACESLVYISPQDAQTSPRSARERVRPLTRTSTHGRRRVLLPQVGGPSPGSARGKRFCSVRGLLRHVALRVGLPSQGAVSFLILSVRADPAATYPQADRPQNFNINLVGCGN